MNPRLRRVLVLTLTAIVTIVVVAIGAFTWTVSTPSGATWAFERLGAIFPGELHVGTLHGPLRGPLTVHNLVYTSEAMDLSIDELSLDWKLRRLLTKKLDVMWLRASNVKMRFKSHAEAARDSAARPLPDIDLPVSVIIRGAIVRHIEILTPASPVPTVLDSVTLATQALRDTLGITNLALRSARYDITLRGSALPQGAYPVNLTVDWRVRQPNRPEMVGGGHLTGTLDTLHVEQHIVAPWQMTLAGVVDHPLRQPAVDGTAAFSGVPLRDLSPTLPDIVASGSVAAKGRSGQFTSRGQVHMLTAQWGALDADFDVAQGLAGWTLHRMNVSVPGRPTRLAMTGSLAANNGPVRLNGHWTSLEWPLRGKPTLQSPRGSFTLNGPLSRYGFNARGDLIAPAAAAGAWNVRGRGNPSGADIDELSTAAMGGRIAGRGRVDWRPNVRWRLALTGTGINPGQRWPSLAGSVNLAGLSQGSVGPSGMTGVTRIDRLAGTAGGRPVTGHGTVTLAGHHAVLSGVRLALGTAMLAADGAVMGPWSLRWSLDAPDLSQALPYGGGVLHARGLIDGPSSAPRIQATVRGESLMVGNDHVRRLVADADVRTASGPLTLDLDAGGVLLGTHRIDHLAVRSRGSRARNTITLSSTTAGDSLQLALAGALRPHEWRGALRTLDLHSRDAGTWTLAAPAPLALSRVDGVALRHLCWRSGGAEVCAATLDWQPSGPFRVDATLTRMPLELARFWMPPDVMAHGPMDGRILIERSTRGALGADVRLMPGPGTLSFPGEARRDSVPFDRGQLTASTAGGQIAARAKLTFPTQGTIDADLRVPAQAGLPAARRPLGGTVRLHLRDLLLLEAVQTELQHPHGTLDADLGLGGTVGHPALAGTARLRGGSADVPRMGIHATSMTADMTGNRGGGLSLDLSAQSGPGTVTIRGRGQLAAWPPAGTITVKGNNVQVMGTPDVTLFANPDLTAKLGGGGGDVTGQIAFPRGDVTLRRRTQAALVLPSSDVVIVGAAASADTAQPLDLHSRVRIAVGPDLMVHAYGFTGKPVGSIEAEDRRGHPTTATGQFDMRDGVYRAYSQNLTIERGRLFFAGGPITDPGVDFRATRTAKDGTVAILQVRGSAAQPDMTVTSRPPLPQREALSYLVLGRKPQTGSAEQGRILDDARNALGIGGGNLVAGRLGAAMGLNTAQLSTQGSVQETALSLGKYLSPRLYVQYGVGLFSPVNTLRMRYIVNRMLTLQVESAEENRAELLYNAER